MVDFKNISESTKDLIINHGLYSNMNVCPLAYHGFKETKENIKQVLIEIDFEISNNHDNSIVNILLEHRYSLQEKLIL